jgi:hypothetical protein
LAVAFHSAQRGLNSDTERSSDSDSGPSVALSDVIGMGNLVNDAASMLSDSE